MRAPSIVLLVSPLLLASSIVERPLPERARRADRVALVQVLDRRTVVPEGDVRKMKTVTRVAVGEDLKGAGPSQIEVTQLGGRHGLWESHVTGDATLAPGETAVLLLRCLPKVSQGWAQCSLLGLGTGKLPVVDGVALVSTPGGPMRRTLSALKAELAAGGSK